MSTSTDSIEVSAATVDEAIGQALEQLRAQHDDVTIEVLSTPRSGLLGLGARQARVRVTRRSPDGASSGVMSPPPAPPPKPRVQPRPVQAPEPARPPASSAAPAAPLRRDAAVSPIPPPERPLARPMLAEEEEHVEELEDQIPPNRRDVSSGDTAPADIDTRAQVAEGKEVLIRILELMGEKATVETVCDDDPEMLELNIKGDGSGLLIGRHGQTLDAIEYILNRIIARQMHEAAPISVDTESYRARRRGQLHRMALAKGEEAKREHQAVMLEPMPPRDRRIIHLALKDDPLITTHSAGDGFLRAVQIVPIDARRDGGDLAGRDRRRGRGARDDSTGQQGGFQHGQKRIV